MAKKIIDTLKDFFVRFTESETDREYRFLSQAQTHAQLEILQQQWDARHRNNRGLWGY